MTKMRYAVSFKKQMKNNQKKIFAIKTLFQESCIRETMRLLPTVPVRSYDFIRICHLDNWSCDYRTHRNRRVNYKNIHNYEFI